MSAYTVTDVKLMKMNLKDKYKFVFRNDFPSLVINVSVGWYEEQG